MTVRNRPLLDRDPVDRLLIAQALAEGIPLLTCESILARYPSDIRLV